MKPIIEARIEPVSSILTQSDGDLFPCAWAQDGALYAANGDGKGFDLQSEWCDIVVNRIDGPINHLTGTRLTGPDGVGSIWADPMKYNRKPTGMVCVDGVLYLAVQNLNKEEGLRAFDDAPCATICCSKDMGKTWEWDKATPMFKDYTLTTIFFLDYGQNSQNCPDDYVYAYGLDYNWRASMCASVPDPLDLYLARVNKSKIMDRTQWEFFSGIKQGQAHYSSEVDKRVPVLTDKRRVQILPPPGKEAKPYDMSVISQGSVVYNKPLDRYIYSSWTESTFEFYEAPNPWGPFRLFLSENFGNYPWDKSRYGGYATVIPSKFISEDGCTMYVQSNTFAGGINRYGFHLRSLKVKLQK